MEKFRKITEINIALNHVVIHSKEFVKIDNVDVELALPVHTISYVNSISGREQLLATQPENVVSSVFAIWGDNPTVEE